MKPWIAVCLLLSIMVVATPSEAGWVRKTLGRVGDATKKFIKDQGITGVIDIVRRYGPGLARLGKRSADCPGPVDKMAQSLMAELELKCPSLFSAGRNWSLTLNDLTAAFQGTDGDKDKALNGPELNLFENTIDAVQHCFDVLKKAGK